MTDDYKAVLNKKLLEVRQIYKTTKLQRDALLDVSYDIDFDVIKITLEAFVLAEKLAGDTQRVNVWSEMPSSTWQMYKKQHQNSWWMRWLVKRRPVKCEEVCWTKEVVFTRYAYYPDADIDLSKRLGNHILIEDYEVYDV